MGPGEKRGEIRAGSAPVGGRLLKHDGERGSVLPLAVLLAFLLIAGIGLGVDATVAAAVKTNQDGQLRHALDRAYSEGFALQLRSSEDPGADIAREVCESLREDGYDGRVEVWYVEAPAGEVPETRRLMAWGVSVEGSSPTTFSRIAGVGSFAVPGFACDHAVPYSEGPVWRPPDDVGGRWTLAEGKPPSYLAKAEGGRGFDIDDCPEAMRAEYEAALDALP